MTPPPTLQELIETVREDAGSDQPLDQLVVAAAAATQLEETTDALLGHFVDRCRRDGRSWTEISNALGVTKQAVHKRFAPAIAAHIFAATPAPALDRFTGRARQVVAASRLAAVSVGADAVGTEHLLLALFTEPEGIAGRALAAMGVTEHSVRASLRASYDRDHGNTAGQDHAASEQAASDRIDKAADSLSVYTDDAKRALRDALAVALELGHNFIGTEHLLLALYRNADSTAAWILGEARALESTARAYILGLLRQIQ